MGKVMAQARRLTNTYFRFSGGDTVLAQDAARTRSGVCAGGPSGWRRRRWIGGGSEMGVGLAQLLDGNSGTKYGPGGGNFKSTSSAFNFLARSGLKKGDLGSESIVAPYQIA